MRAIQLVEPRRFEQVEVAEPESLGPGEALVRTHRMGVCGTDISGYLGKMPFFKYPRIPGHELGVEVLDVADDVGNVQPGDRCSVEPYMNCGDCFACRRGCGNCCENLEVIGVMADGGLRERFVVRADKLHPSGRLAFEQLALVETLAIGCHAMDRADPVDDEHLLIIGAGPIGLATLEFAQLTGAMITVMDRLPSRLEFCRERYGVEHTLLFQSDGREIETMQSLTDGEMFPTVIDATGNARSMSHAVNYVAHTGSLVYVGITTEEVAIPHPAIHKREMCIKGSRNAMPSDFERIIGWIEEGDIDTGPWITHRVTFDGMIDEFDSYTRPETGVIKAIVDVSGE